MRELLELPFRAVQVDDFAKEVDDVCCGRDGSNCPNNGTPASCSAGCAVTIHQFTSDCADTLAVVLEPDDPFRLNVITTANRA